MKLIIKIFVISLLFQINTFAAFPNPETAKECQNALKEQLSEKDQLIIMLARLNIDKEAIRADENKKMRYLGLQRQFDEGIKTYLKEYPNESEADLKAAITVAVEKLLKPADTSITSNTQRPSISISDSIRAAAEYGVEKELLPVEAFKDAIKENRLDIVEGFINMTKAGVAECSRHSGNISYCLEFSIEVVRSNDEGLIDDALKNNNDALASLLFENQFILADPTLVINKPHFLTMFIENAPESSLLNTNFLIAVFKQKDITPLTSLLQRLPDLNDKSIATQKISSKVFGKLPLNQGVSYDFINVPHCPVLLGLLVGSKETIELLLSKFNVSHTWSSPSEYSVSASFGDVNIINEYFSSIIFFIQGDEQVKFLLAKGFAPYVGENSAWVSSQKLCLKHGFSKRFKQLVLRQGNLNADAKNYIISNHADLPDDIWDFLKKNQKSLGIEIK